MPIRIAHRPCRKVSLSDGDRSGPFPENFSLRFGVFFGSTFRDSVFSNGERSAFFCNAQCHYFVHAGSGLFSTTKRHFLYL